MADIRKVFEILETSQDWQLLHATVEQAQEAVGAIEDATEKARYFYRLGGIMETKFVRKDIAMKNFQLAWKSSPQSEQGVRALEEARRIYREMGNLKMVSQLLSLELKATQDSARRADSLLLLGQVYLDLRQRADAVAAFKQVLELRSGDAAARSALDTFGYDGDGWVNAVLQRADEADNADDRRAAELYLTCARIFLLEEPDSPDVEKNLRKALDANPNEPHANYLFEQVLSDAGRWEDLGKLHESRVEKTPAGAARAELWADLATMWGHRFQNAEMSREFYARALQTQPWNPRGLAFFRGLAAANGDWRSLAELAKAGLAGAADNETRVRLGTELALLYWRQLADVDGARALFAQVRAAGGNPPELAIFEEKYGAQSGAAPTTEKKVLSSAADGNGTGADVDVDVDVGDGDRAAAPPISSGPQPAVPAAASATTAPAAPAAPPRAPAAAAQAATLQPPEPDEPLPPELAKELADLRSASAWPKLAEALRKGTQKLTTRRAKLDLLREAVEVFRDKLKVEAQVVTVLNDMIKIDPAYLPALEGLCTQYDAMKRWPDLIKVLKTRADLLRERFDGGDTSVKDELVGLYSQRADLFLERFSNQAEAIKVFEALLEVDPTSVRALDYLSDMYEKRRDWERLLAVRGRKASLIQDPRERYAAMLANATMATERLKRPNVLVQLWNEILDVQPDAEEALSALEGLHEKAREWEPLGDICLRRVALTQDVEERKKLFTKIGQIYGERINVPDKAIAAWRELLVLEPGNKRAQDALKKKYLEVRDYDALEEFYADTGKWDEFIRLLEREAGTADNDAAKAKITYKVGELWLTKLDKADRALKAFEKVFEYEATNNSAALALIPIYQEAGKFDRLAAMMEIKLGHLTDPAERLQLTLDIAAINEQQLGSAKGALQWFVNAHAEDPTREDIRDEVERLAGATKTWAAAAQAFERGIARYQGAAEALSLELRCARVHETELGQAEPALSHYVAALKIDGNHGAALAGSERIYEALSRWQDLLGILRRKIALAPDDAARVVLLYKVASIHETKLDEKDQAIAAYRGIVEIAGEDLRALEALDRLYEKKQDWPSLAQIMDRELKQVDRQTPAVPAALADAGDDEEGEDAAAAKRAATQARAETIKTRQVMLARAVTLKYRLGQVREKHLSEPAKAIGCYREIFAIEPKHEGARVALEGLLKTQSAHKLEIADILEPVYPHFEMWQALIEVHFIQLSSAKDPVKKAEVLGKIGEVQSARLKDHKGAFKTLTEAFTLNPKDAKTFKRIENAAAGLGNWEELVKLYRSTADQAGKSDQALGKSLRLRVASLYGERLGDVQGAERAFKEALKESPEDLEALDGLCSLYAATSNWTECLKTYARKIELAPAADIERRKALNVEVAQIEEEKLGDRGAAVKTYQRILVLDPKAFDALRALERLFKALSQWNDLAANLTRQLELAESTEDTVALKYRLAGLRAGEMKDTAAAVEIYREILSLDPDHADTLGSMERLLADDGHQLAVSRILEPLYEAKGLWQKVIGAYEIQIKHSPPAERVELLHKIAGLQETQGQSQRDAFAAYARALKEDASHDATQNELDRVAGELSDYPSLVAVYESVGAGLTDRALAVEVWTKAAHLHEDVLESQDGAERCYAEVVKHDPRNLDAIRALKRLYSGREKWAQYVEILKMEADCLDTVEEQKEILAEAARVTEEVLESREGAIGVYQKVLEKDERDQHALAQLERLFAETERWQDLAGIYQRLADLADEDQEARKQAYFKMGAVYETALANGDKAIETFRTVLDMDPEDATALESLDRLYVATSKWSDLLSILERRVGLADEPIRLKHRMGEVLETKLNEPVRAIETYREVLAGAPDDKETIAALERLRTSGTERLFAAQVLEPIYETEGEFEKLVQVKETMLELAEEPEKRVELNLTIADLWESKLDRPEPAFEGLVRAVKDDPTNEQVLGVLERLAGQIPGGWRILVTKMEEQLAGISVPENAIEVSRRIARIAEINLEANDEAISKYERVLELDAADADAIRSLDRLYHEKGDFPKLAGILSRQIERADESEARVALLFRLAQLRQTSLGEPELGIENYREILEINETHEPTLTALEALFSDGKSRDAIGAILDPLYRTQGEWEKLVRIHQDLLDGVTGEEARLRAIRTVAELYEEKLSDQASALAWWGQAFREAPGNEAVNEELERLAKETSQWEGVCGLFEEKLAKAEEEKLDKGLQKIVTLKLAKAYEAELADVERAESTYRRVLALDAGDAEALVALDRIYDSTGENAPLAEILRKRVEITQDKEERADLRMRLGTLLAGKLGDTAGAVTQYEAIVEADGAHADALAALEQIFGFTEEWPRLFAVHEKQVANALGDDAQAGFLSKMADLAAYRLNKVPEAIDLWRKVLDLAGEEANALQAVEALYEQTERWKDVVDALERQVMVVEHEGLRAKLYTKMGRVWGERLHKERQALDAWREVLALEPDNLGALKAVAAIYKNTEAWEELNETIEKMIQIGQDQMSDAEVMELWARRGDLLAQVLMRPGDAIDCWTQVLDLAPENLRAIGALEELYTQEAKWPETVRILERKAELLQDPAQKIAVYLQVSSIWDDKIGEREKGASSYEKILELDPAHSEASRALEQIYQDSSDWQALIQLLLNRLEHVEEVPARVEILQHVAGIYEREMLDADNAMEILKLAFQMDYENDTTASEIERLAQATGKWAELIAEYTQVVQASEEDAETQVNLGNKIARWYGEQLAQPEVAIQWYQFVLTKDANNLEGLDALDGLFRRTKRWPELVSVLDRRARLTKDPEEQRDAWCRLAEVYEEQLSRPQDAITAYRVALGVDKENLDTLAALERLYRSQQSWEQLIEILEAKAKATVDSEDLVEIRQSIADLWEDQLNSLDNAIGSYRQIVELDQKNVRALRSLERLYTRTEKWDELIKIIDLALEVVDTDPERVELLSRKAALWEEEFKKIDQATECYEKILGIEQANQPAFRALERLYRQLSRWQDLLELYRNRIFAIQDNTEILENYLHIGTIWAERLGDEGQAIEAFTSMLDIDPDSVPALDWLSRLFEKAREDDRALEYMNRLVDLLDDPKQRVELYYRMGKIYEERLQDVDAAIGKYQFASDVDPSYIPVAKALVEIYKAREDWENAVLVLKQQEQHTADPEEKSHLLFEAGEIYRGKLYSEPQAQEFYERAIQGNPTSIEAASPLSDIYFTHEAWAQAEPLLDLLTTAARRQAGRAKESSEQLNTWHYRSAVVSDRLGKFEKADEQYRYAYEMNAQHLPTLVGLADLYYRTEQWDKSFKLFQTVLVHHRDAQSPEEIVEIFFKLGNIKLRLGEKRKALNMYEKALEVNPHHNGTLDAIIDLYEKANDWENVINYKRSKVEAATNEKERFVLLMDIGDLWNEKLKNVPKAIQSFQDALDQDPASRNALSKLMELYTGSRQWKKAIEVMEKIAELEEDGKRRSRYWYAIATIFRDELKQPEESVEFFNKSLDDDVDFLKGFEAIDTIFTAKKDWKNLERNYRKMIKRVPNENKELQIMLWHGLGEIYRSRMGQGESAATAFEVASSLDPNNIVRHEILAELWSADPEKWEKAVQRHHILIGLNPNRVESFKSLYQIYMNSQQYDKAFCVAGTLKFLRQAPPDAEGFYEQYKQKGLVRAKRRLDAELWRKSIIHKSENPFIGAVFGLIGPAVASQYRKELKRYVKKKERVDLATSPLTFCRYFSYVAQTLGVTVPELYHKPGAMGLNFLNADVAVPVVVVGDDMLQGRTEKELVFLIAKHLTYMRPEYYLIRALEMQTLTLKAIFLATLKLIIPSANVPAADVPAVQQILPVIQKTVPPTVMGQVKKILEHFLQAQGGVDLSRWMEHAELTANRVGYILCGELEQSAHTIQTEATPLSSMTVKDKIQDLVQYSISEEYLKVRSALGMSITG